MIAKRIGYGVAVLVLLASALYVFVYLYRWEWNRAIIAGVFLIVSSLALATAAILDRINKLEARLDQQTAAPTALPIIEATRPEAHNHFAWLGDAKDMNVFVPVLMGAGVVVSAIAWLVERIAMTTARPSLERGLSLDLVSLTPPMNGLLGAPVAPVTRKRGLKVLKAPVVGVLVIALLWGGIDLLADLTQGRPDLRSSGAASQITLEVRADDADLTSATMAAQGLWGACRSTLNKPLEASPVIDRSGGFVRIFVQPALGENSKKRLVGCLEDALIDHVQARVVSIRNFSG